MVIIHKHTQARSGKVYCQAHYIKQGRFVRSSDIHPFSDNVISFLTKGHSLYCMTNVASKADLAFKYNS